MRRSVLPLVLATVSVDFLDVRSTLQAQTVPKRPVLAANVDTNSALAYYSYGSFELRRNPTAAANAFYWAARLDPTWGQPLYARRIALILASDDLFVTGYMDGVKSFTRSPAGRRIDSLELRARMVSPLLHREFDKDLLLRYVRAQLNLAQRGGVDPTLTMEWEFYLQAYWRTRAPPLLRAMLASSERRFPEALNLYRLAIKDSPDMAGEIHVARARIFFLIESLDSARAEMQSAIDELREQDATDFVYLYESKAVLEYALGLIYEESGQIGPAREAYARALQEDLSYYPAHMRLALLALQEGDTTTAVSEMDLATQIKDDDPWTQATYGTTLAQAGRLEEANQHLRRAVEVDPYFAFPYYVLGRLAEVSASPEDAVTHYQAYLARVEAQEPRIGDVRRRLADLGVWEGGPR